MTGRSEKPDAGADAAEAFGDAIDAANKKASDALEMAMRIQADFDNYRKRSQKENEEFRKYATETLISDILGIVDDLDRALLHADRDSHLTAGVNGIRSNLMKMMNSHGVTEIPVAKFDPSVHEALCVVPGEKDGDIAEVFQKGYRIGDRVLRYAKVKVTKRSTEEEGEQKCQES